MGSTLLFTMAHIFVGIRKIVVCSAHICKQKNKIVSKEIQQDHVDVLHSENGKPYVSMKKLQKMDLCPLSHLVMTDPLSLHGLLPTRLLCPWNSPGKNTTVGCHSLLHSTFPSQGSNLGLLHCRQILYHLSNEGSPYLPSNPMQVE